jgi:hypothetical protein
MGAYEVQDAAPVTVQADMDQHCYVDADDFAAFETCSTGPGLSLNVPGCARAKLDGDDDVDQVDFGLFQRCLSGENVPRDPNCLN